MPDNDITLTAQWTRNNWTVTYEPGSEGVTRLPASASAIAGDAYRIPSRAPAKANHTFTGWLMTTGGDGNYRAGSSFRMPDNNVTLTAQWTKNNRTVTYAPGGEGVTVMPSAASVPAESEYTIPETTPERENYTFTGWRVTSGGCGSYEPGNSFTMPDNNITLTAQWARNNWRVTYAPGSEGVTRLPSAATVQAGNEYTIPAATMPTRANHTVTGWLITTGGEGSYEPGNSFTMPNNDVTLTAQWTRNNWTVTYAPGGEGVSGLPPSASAIAGDEYAIPASAPARANHTFTGWLITSGASGSYGAGESFTMPDSDITLTAQWTRNYSTDTYAPG
jgi:uncharacterized repeat protein (TIGR02543 family)